MKAPTYNSILWPKSTIWTGRRAKRLLNPLASQDTDIPSAWMWICSTRPYTYVTLETSLFNLIYVGCCALESKSCTRISKSDPLTIFLTFFFILSKQKLEIYCGLYRNHHEGVLKYFTFDIAWWKRRIVGDDQVIYNLYWYFGMFSKKESFLCICVCICRP